MRFKLVIFTLSFFLLSACAETQLVSHMAKQFPAGQSPKQQGTFKVGKPYSTDGRTYVPQENYTLTETGIASWYGPGFDGKRTANGERFDKNELTGAHRTLQMPSLVRVTNLDNGRSLVIRINDRGPFKRGRILDVSQKAAELLGFRNIGTAKVKLQVLTQESMQIAEAAKRGQDTRGTEVAMNESGRLQPISMPSGQPVYPQAQQPIVPGHLKNGEFFPDPVVKQMPVTRTHIYVQTGSFSDPANATRLAQNLHSLGDARVIAANVNGRIMHRVRIGPFAAVEQADSMLSKVVSSGHPDAIIVVD
jgi:rare lipoprotein A